MALCEGGHVRAGRSVVAAAAAVVVGVAAARRVAAVVLARRRRRRSLVVSLVVALADVALVAVISCAGTWRSVWAPPHPSWTVR